MSAKSAIISAAIWVATAEKIAVSFIVLLLESQHSFMIVYFLAPFSHVVRYTLKYFIRYKNLRNNIYTCVKRLDFPFWEYRVKFIRDAENRFFFTSYD